MTIHTKNDNYTDNYKCVVLNVILIQVDGIHTTSITVTIEENYIIGITFRAIWLTIETLSIKILIYLFECSFAPLSSRTDAL